MKGHIVLKDKEHAEKCFKYLLRLGYKRLPGTLISEYIENAFGYDYLQRDKEYKHVFVVDSNDFIYTSSDMYDIIKKMYPIEIKYEVNCMDIE